MKTHNVIIAKKLRKLGSPIVVHAPFLNNDVPKFLAELDRFEKRSRKRRIKVGCKCAHA